MGWLFKSSRKSFHLLFTNWLHNAFIMDIFYKYLKNVFYCWACSWTAKKFNLKRLEIIIGSQCNFFLVEFDKIYFLSSRYPFSYIFFSDLLSGHRFRPSSFVSWLLSNTQDSRLSCSYSLKFYFVDRFVHSKESPRSRRAARNAWGLMDYRL